MDPLKGDAPTAHTFCNNKLSEDRILQIPSLSGNVDILHKNKDRWMKPVLRASQARAKTNEM
jgi:hypothetical protein